MIMYISNGIKFQKQIHYFVIKNGRIRQLFRTGIVSKTYKVTEQCKYGESSFKDFFNLENVEKYDPIFFRPDDNEIGHITTDLI
jgi:hypothetical protein